MNNQVTFLNGDSKHKARGLDEMNSRADDIRVFMNNYDGNEDTGPFDEYGLSFDYVEPGTFKDQDEGYYRYQFCWGGPSSELRLYVDRSEFVFLDWFVGVGFDVTDEDWVKFIHDEFEGLGMLDFDSVEIYG